MKIGITIATVWVLCGVLTYGLLNADLIAFEKRLERDYKLKASAETIRHRFREHHAFAVMGTSLLGVFGPVGAGAAYCLSTFAENGLRYTSVTEQEIAEGVALSQ